MILGKVFRKRGLTFLTPRFSKNQSTRSNVLVERFLIKKVFKLSLIGNFNVLQFLYAKGILKKKFIPKFYAC